MESPDFVRPKAKTKELEKESQILNVEKKDKYKTIEELFVQSQPSSMYYTLLVLSVVIVTCGLLLQNAPIVIGGMLVTPILTPILVISLGISTAELGATKGPLILLLKSTLFSIVISGVFTLLFGIQDITQIFVNDLRTAMLYFVVASASGVAATFAWVRKEVSDILPGVAISVSLVPPLSLLGINLGTFSFEYARFYLIIYFLNLFGIIVGSLIVFSLLKFQKSKKVVKEKVKEVEDLKKFKEAKNKAQKAFNKMEQVKKNVSEAIELEERQKQNKKSDQDE